MNPFGFRVGLLLQLYYCDESIDSVGLSYHGPFYER